MVGWQTNCRFSGVMKSLWPIWNGPGRNWNVTQPTAVCLLFLFSGAPIGWAATPFVRVSEGLPSGRLVEQRLQTVPAHIAEFDPMAEPSSDDRCARVRPPEALLSPDPLLPAEDPNLSVRVSFIVGIDGHVHSAFILESDSPDEDQAVLRTIQQWRFRPALCNGIPTDSEARVQFSIR